MTYLKIAIGLGFVAVLVCEVLWLLRLDTGFPNDWPVVLGLLFFVGMFGVVRGLNYSDSPWRGARPRTEKSVEINPWSRWLLAVAVVAALIWRSLPSLGPALGCDVSGSKGWIVRQLCDNVASRARK